MFKGTQSSVEGRLACDPFSIIDILYQIYPNSTSEFHQIVISDNKT